MAVLVYHIVDDRFSLGVTRIAPRRFSEHVNHLLENGFGFFTVSDYLVSEAPRKLALTFDDGYASVFEHAFPVLRALKIPATVFVNPGYIGHWNTWDVNLAWQRFRLMDWEQLESLQQEGWEIGIHGLRHRDLSRQTDERLEVEIGLAQRLLENRLRFSSVISYPFGNTSARVVKTCRKYLLTTGLTMSRKPTDVPSHFALQRFGVYPFDSLKSLRRKAAGGSRCAGMLQRLMDICSDATVLMKQRIWQLD